MKCWLFGAGEWGKLCLEQVKSKYIIYTLYAEGFEVIKEIR